VIVKTPEMTEKYCQFLYRNICAIIKDSSYIERYMVLSALIFDTAHFIGIPVDDFNKMIGDSYEKYTKELEKEVE